VRGLRLLALGILVALTSASVSGASGSELPRGWWKGTMVLEERWDRITADSPYQWIQGSATVRVLRDTYETAEFELEYRQEVRHRDLPQVDAECRGKLWYVWTSTLRKRGPIGLHVSGGGGTASFSIATPVQAELDGMDYDCVTGVGEPYPAGNTNLMFGFSTRAPDTARRRTGSAPLQRSVFHNFDDPPRPGGVNAGTTSWDLELVPETLPAGPVRLGRVTLTRPKPSFVKATVQVAKGGQPVRTENGRCTRAFSKPRPSTLTLGARTEVGRVVCTYVFNNARFAGQRMNGSLSFSVGTQRVTRSFSVRVGRGTALSRPLGAVVSAPRPTG
jgi:hypothetical protein